MKNTFKSIKIRAPFWDCFEKEWNEEAGGEKAVTNPAHKNSGGQQKHALQD